MRILFNNVNFDSRSGPNGFGLKLARQLIKVGHEIVAQDPDVALSFIQGYVPGTKNVLRLDGIWFNVSQDWKKMNEPIRKSYDLADSIIVQSEFNKELVFNYFGKRENVQVVHNGTDLSILEKIHPANTDHSRNETWLCASSWRPHKRLAENIEYFQCAAGEKDVLFVAGSGDAKAAIDCKDPRVVYVGDLSWEHLVSLMKAASNFIHLAYLDHCPNVVVDARAAGCRIVCSDSGGTVEIAGSDAVVVKDTNWDFSPTALYEPPGLDMSNLGSPMEPKSNNIVDVCDQYCEIFENLVA